MKSRLNDIPIIKSVPSYVGATHFNRVRLSQIRLDNSLRLELFSLRGLDIVIDDDAWVCIDRTLGDLPVLAWTDFDKDSRKGLHQPVSCKWASNRDAAVCSAALRLFPSASPRMPSSSTQET